MPRRRRGRLVGASRRSTDGRVRGGQDGRRRSRRPNGPEGETNARATVLGRLCGSAEASQTDSRAGDEQRAGDALNTYSRDVVLWAEKRPGYHGARERSDARRALGIAAILVRPTARRTVRAGSTRSAGDGSLRPPPAVYSSRESPPHRSRPTTPPARVRGPTGQTSPVRDADRLRNRNGDSAGSRRSSGGSISPIRRLPSTRGEPCSGLSTTGG